MCVRLFRSEELTVACLCAGDGHRWEQGHQAHQAHGNCGGATLREQRHLPGPRLASKSSIERLHVTRSMTSVSPSWRTWHRISQPPPATADPDSPHVAPVAVLLAVHEASLAADEHGCGVHSANTRIKGVNRPDTRFRREKARRRATFEAELPSNRRIDMTRCGNWSRIRAGMAKRGGSAALVARHDLQPRGHRPGQAS